VRIGVYWLTSWSVGSSERKRPATGSRTRMPSSSRPPSPRP
jgi:hypothetical protein